MPRLHGFTIGICSFAVGLMLGMCGATLYDPDEEVAAEARSATAAAAALRAENATLKSAVSDGEAYAATLREKLNRGAARASLTDLVNAHWPGTLITIDGKYSELVQHRYVHLLWEQPPSRDTLERHVLAIYRLACEDIRTQAPDSRYKMINIWVDDRFLDYGKGMQLCQALTAAGPTLPDRPGIRWRTREQENMRDYWDKERSEK